MSHCIRKSAGVLVYLVVVQILATKWALYSQSPSRQSGSITQCARLLQPVSVIYLIYAALKEAVNLSHDCEDKLRLEDVMQHNFSYSTPTTSGRVKDGGVCWWYKTYKKFRHKMQALCDFQNIDYDFYKASENISALQWYSFPPPLFLNIPLLLGICRHSRAMLGRCGLLVNSVTAHARTSHK